MFWEVVGLERGLLSLVSTIEELLGRNSSGSSPKNREYGHGDPLHWPRDTLYLQKVGITSPTCGGRSVDIVCLRTKTAEFVVCINILCWHETLLITWNLWIARWFSRIQWLRLALSNETSRVGVFHSHI
jgi:hypothetical protein